MPEQRIIETLFSGATLEMSFAPRVISISPQIKPSLYSGFILKKDKIFETKVIICSAKIWQCKDCRVLAVIVIMFAINTKHKTKVIWVKI